MLAAMHPLTPILVLFLLAATFVHGQVRNVTIDDGMGDEDLGVIPRYGGTAPWCARMPGDSCVVCFLEPARDKMFDGTWHDATTSPTEEPAEIKFAFRGTDLFIFCTLAGPRAGTVTETHLTLTVDGVSRDTFDWVPDVSSPEFQYQYPVLAANGLKNGNHTVKVLNHPVMVNGQAIGSLILFDYALYTTDALLTNDGAASSSTTEPASSSTPTDQKANNSKLVLPLGIICGVVGLVLLIGSLVVFLRFRRRRQTQSYQRFSDHVPAKSQLRLPAPPAEVRLVPGSRPSTQPLNLGVPVVPAFNDRKLNTRAALMSDKNRRSGRDDLSESPPSYS